MRDEDGEERLRLWLCCARPRGNMPSKVSAVACARKSEEEERGGYPPDPPSEDDGTCADDGGGRDGPAAPRDDGVRDDGVRDEDDVERLRL